MHSALVATYLHLVRQKGAAAKVTGNATSNVNDGHADGADELFCISHDPHLEGNRHK